MTATVSAEGGAARAGRPPFACMIKVCYDVGMTNSEVTAPAEQVTAKLVYALTVHGVWHVHRAGCIDARWAARHGEYQEKPVLFPALTHEDVFNEVIDPEMRELGYSEHDMDVHSCVDAELERVTRRNDGEPVATLQLNFPDEYTAAHYRVLFESQETLRFIGPRIHNPEYNHRLKVWADVSCTGGRGTHVFNAQPIVVSRKLSGPAPLPAAGIAAEGDLVQLVDVDGHPSLWQVVVQPLADPVLVPYVKP